MMMGIAVEELECRSWSLYRYYICRSDFPVGLAVYAFGNYGDGSWV